MPPERSTQLRCPHGSRHRSRHRCGVVRVPAARGASAREVLTDPQKPFFGETQVTSAKQPMSLFDRSLILPAVSQAFRKLDVRLMIKNPVMFVTMVGATLTTVAGIADLRRPRFRDPTRCLALVHGAVCQFRRSDGRRRGKAQAATLRKARKETMARRLAGWPRGKSSGAELLEGATRWSAKRAMSFPPTAKSSKASPAWTKPPITGESAPVIRESGGDRSAVTGGTRVISDRIVVRITMETGPGISGPDDRDGRRRETPEDAQ